MPGDAVQQGVPGHELLEAQPSTGVGHGLRDDQHPYGVRSVLLLVALQAGDAGGLGGGAAGEFLVVPEGDGPFLGAQGDRRAGLGLLDGLAVHSPARGLAVDDLGDVRDGAAQDLHRAACHVAGPAAAGAVAAGADHRALGGDHAVLPQGAVGFADGGAEGEFAGGRVQGDVAVVGAGGGEVRDDLPVRPAVALGGLEEQGYGVADDRGVGEPEPLPGEAGGLAEGLVVDGVGVDDGGGAADGEGLGGADGRRGGVEGLVGVGFGDAAAQPARLLAAVAGQGVAGGDVQDDRAGPVETAGAVAVHLAGLPAVGGPRLPHQGRLTRVDADTVDAAVEFEGEGAVRDGGGEAEQHRVAGVRRLREAHDVVALGEVVRAVDDLLAPMLDDQMPQGTWYDG